MQASRQAGRPPHYDSSKTKDSPELCKGWQLWNGESWQATRLDWLSYAKPQDVLEHHKSNQATRPGHLDQAKHIQVAW